MAKQGKKMKAALALVDRNKFYTVPEAVAILKKAASARKFDESFDVSMNLDIDPRQADQQIRGMTELPNGTGVKLRVAVFAKDAKAEEARKAGADIVGSDDLPSAVRLNATSRQLGILFGPAVGGGLMLWFGAPTGLFINALIYLPLTIWLMVVPYTGHARDGMSARRALRWRDAFDVIRDIADNRPILTMIVLGGAASLFVGNAFQANMPEFAHDLGTEKADFAYSALLAANAAGSVFGGFVLDGKAWVSPTAKSAISCAILWCVAMTAFAFSNSYPLSLVLLFIAGALNLSFYSIAQTIVQLEAPVNLRGRLIGLFSMSAYGLRAFSGFTVGVVGGLIGVHWSLALSSMILLAVTVALFAFAAQKQAAEELGRN